jgi:hypothetical protein
MVVLHTTAVVRGQLTCHAVLTLLNSRSHKGQSRRDDGRVNNAKNGVRDRGIKEQLCLGSKRTFNKTIGQTLGTKVTK